MDIPLSREIPQNKVFRINPRADAIRSKLIYTFYLIDHLQGLSHAVPRHNIRDFLDDKKQTKLMFTDHHQLVRFNVVPSRNILVTQERRWRNRIHVRCSLWPPLNMWASWVLSSDVFKVFMIFLIVTNMLVLMVLSEMSDNKRLPWVKTRMALEVIVWVIILFFLMEIGLHWVVSFERYWKNSWNVFDFTVTLISFFPEFIKLFDLAYNKKVIWFVHFCRVLRCLKLFPRIPQVRVLIITIIKALKAMAFILAFLLFFFFVFAVSGIFFFESYGRSERADLEYHWYFTDMPNSLVTIFILFTMDHWYALLQDMWKVPDINTIISGFFIFLWLFTGAFIFRNLMVAVMVTNFQHIRSDLSEEMTQIETQKQADKFKVELMERRYSLSQEGHPEMPARSPDLLGSETGSYFMTGDYSDFQSHESHMGGLDWETYIQKNLPGLYEADDDEQVVWPRDFLFRYFELLEKLQYNLEERKHLQHYAVFALANMEDK